MKGDLKELLLVRWTQKPLKRTCLLQHCSKSSCSLSLSGLLLSLPLVTLHTLSLSNFSFSFSNTLGLKSRIRDLQIMYLPFIHMQQVCSSSFFRWIHNLLSLLLPFFFSSSLSFSLLSSFLSFFTSLLHPPLFMRSKFHASLLIANFLSLPSIKRNLTFSPFQKSQSRDLAARNKSPSVEKLYKTWFFQLFLILSSFTFPSPSSPNFAQLFVSCSCNFLDFKVFELFLRTSTYS